MATFQTPPPEVLGRGDVRDKAWRSRMEQLDMQRSQDVQAKLVGAVTSSWGLAVIAGLVVMLLLWFLNPPMVQQGGRSSLEKQKPSPLKIVAWGVGAGLVVGLTPLVLQWIR
jgi:hypothetical protein